MIAKVTYLQKIPVSASMWGSIIFYLIGKITDKNITFILFFLTLTIFFGI